MLVFIHNDKSKAAIRSFYLLKLFAADCSSKLLDAHFAVVS